MEPSVPSNATLGDPPRVPSPFESTIQQVESLVDELYVIHDECYTSERKSKLSSLVRQILDKLQELPPHVPAKIKAAVLYLRGKALDALPEYSKDAEDVLSKAVKLDPYNLDAWNCLGHVFWKKSDLVSSRRCFEGALAQCGPNKVSLRQLSMVLRSTANTVASESEKKDLLLEALLKAKEAVKLDLTDGLSWYLLGNSHLFAFFGATQDSADLSHALKAYHQAEARSQRANPDLFFNRATVFKYLENYQSSISEFARAHSIDPSLRADQKAEQIVNAVAKTSLTISTKGRLKPKKLAALLKSLPDTVPEPVRSRVVAFSQLSLGPNQGMMIAAKVVSPVPRDQDLPACFILVDGQGSFFGLSLYHTDLTAYDILRPFETVCVLHPFSHNIVLSLKDKTWSYPAVRVTDPGHILVGGVPLHTSSRSSLFAENFS